MDIKYLLRIVIMLAFMIGFSFLPVIEPLTPLGMKILGIFLGTLYGLIRIDFIVPSLIAMLALGLTGYMPMKDIFMTGFGSDIVMFVIFFLAIAAITNESGASDIIAKWFISQKVNIERPWVFTCLLFWAAYLIGMAISLTATILLMWNIFYQICKQLEIPPKSKYAMYTLVGIMFSATVGYQVFPFKPVPALVLATYEGLSCVSVNYSIYMLLAFIVSLICMLLYILFGKMIVRPEMSFANKLNKEMIQSFKNNKVTLHQKAILMLVAAAFICLVLPSILPQSLSITKLLNILGTTGIIVLFVCIIGLIRKNQESYMPIGKMLQNGVQWDVIIMMACMMPLCASFSSEKTQIMNFVIFYMEPLFETMSPVVFSFIILIVCMIMIQFLGNVAAAAIIVPLMYSFSVMLHANHLLLVIMIGICINVGFLTPASSTMAALLHGNHMWISTSKAYFYGGVIVLINLIAILIVCCTLGNVLIG